jgi:hypothetical protein
VDIVYRISLPSLRTSLHPRSIKTCYSLASLHYTALPSLVVRISYLEFAILAASIEVVMAAILLPKFQCLHACEETVMVWGGG